MERYDEEDQLHPWRRCETGKKSVDCSRGKARMTEEVSNEAGEVEDEDILILRSEKEAFTSMTERVSQMLSSRLAFSGISRSVDLFQPLKHCLRQQKLVQPVLEHQCLMSKKLLTSRPEGSRSAKGTLNRRIIK